MDYIKQIEEFRKEKDLFFKTSPYTPLTPEQQRKFQGLEYFQVEEKYRFIVELKELKNKTMVKIITSKGTEQEYIRYGVIEFEVDGTKCMLTVFKQPNSDYFFVPFKDKTTGKETYGAGRYIELEHIKGNKYILDFNLAYNPYCAYNDNWVCPLVPFENHLSVEIKAGEKAFK